MYFQERPFKHSCVRPCCCSSIIDLSYISYLQMRRVLNKKEMDLTSYSHLEVNRNLIESWNYYNIVF